MKNRTVSLIYLALLVLVSVFLIWTMFAFLKNIELINLYYIAVYSYLAVATSSLLYLFGDNTKNKLRHSIIFGVFWPITWIIRLCTKDKK